MMVLEPSLHPLIPLSCRNSSPLAAFASFSKEEGGGGVWQGVTFCSSQNMQEGYTNGRDLQTAGGAVGQQDP